MHYAGVAKALAQEGMAACDVLLADLGASSMQLDDPRRGFSYKHDGPLDMRMNTRLKHSAADLLETLTEEELTLVLHRDADEPDAVRIARRIILRRNVAPLRRTVELVRLVFEAKGIDPCAWRAARRKGEARQHPAARTFQALRILVNDELHGLEQLLRVAPYCLNPGGRLGILSFHSGEHDRVHQALRRDAEAGLYAEFTAEPLQPAPAEVASNPRARSALFHWARRNGTGSAA